MKKIFSLALIGALTTAPALGQQASYTSINQVMLAAQQASSGQLTMVHGGYFGTPVASGSSTVANTAADPTTGIGNDNSTTLIAATVGAAVLVIPFLLNWFSND